MYDLPSVASLVRYLHGAAGFLTKRTWLNAIKADRFDTWPGLNYYNASTYLPQATETIKEHMTKTRKGIRSTKAKPHMVEARAPAPQQASTTTHEVHI